MNKKSKDKAQYWFILSSAVNAYYTGVVDSTTATTKENLIEGLLDSNHRFSFIVGVFPITENEYIKASEWVCDKATEIDAKGLVVKYFYNHDSINRNYHSILGLSKALDYGDCWLNYVVYTNTDTGIRYQLMCYTATERQQRKIEANKRIKIKLTFKSDKDTIAKLLANSINHGCRVFIRSVFEFTSEGLLAEIPDPNPNGIKISASGLRV